MIRYRGLTWDHPRGFNALAAAADRLRSEDGIAIDWEKQPLEGFESHPIEDLCSRYDLVVLDHPHVGEAVARECLVALEEVFTSGDVADWSRHTIGPCFRSYRCAGRHWALPLDAATQVMALRPDLTAERPGSWDDVLECSASMPVALPMSGPHPILTFFSLATAFGEPPGEADPQVLVSADTGKHVLAVMATLYARMPDVARALNPIGVLARMAARSDIALCPLVYGYVNYAVSHGEAMHPIAFHDAPCAQNRQRHGSTLGGTGIGITRRCSVTPALLEHLRWLMSADAQNSFIPMHDGQPSRREAWYDDTVNTRCGNFFRNTAETVSDAYVRPRYPGYITFQTEASELLRRGLAESTAHRTILERLQAGYTRSRPAGAEH